MTEAATPAAVIVRAEDRQRVFLGYAGTHGPASVPAEWLDKLREAGLLYLDGWAYRHGHPALLRECVEDAAARDVGVLFDPGPYGVHIEPEWLRAVLAHTYVVLITEAEAHALTGLSDQRAGLSRLREWGARVVALKRGKRGCLIDTGDQHWECAPYPVEAHDPTAAGDCFAAAVAWGLLHQKPWDVIGALANAVGAAKVQKLGSGLAAPTRAEVESLLQTHRPDLLAHFEQPSKSNPR
jgi:sugar/nucleoside kinase (ribokinase family)